MTIEATAAALAQDEAISAPETVTPEAAPEAAVDLAAIYDKVNAEPEAAKEPQEAAPEAQTDPEQAGAPVEPEAEPEAASDAPTDLPAGVKKAWAHIPEEARNGFVEAQREMSRKLSEQGRQMQGIAPIRDSLVAAVKELPALADMRPEEVARDVMALAKQSAAFREKPVETMIGLIKQHGLEQAIGQALGGQGVTDGARQNAALAQQVQQLQKQLAQVTNPEFMRSQVQALTAEQQTVQTVNEFAQTMEHWADVEHLMPQAIQFAQSMSPDASPKDTLERAYSMALSQIKPDALKAIATPGGVEPTPIADPERSKKAQKAKSVNVNSAQPGRPRAKTEVEMMEEIWAKNQS